MSIDTHILWYAAEWTIRIGALAVVPLRRSPASSRAWLLLIFFLPVPGLFLYLAVGTPRFPAWRARRFRVVADYFRETSLALDRYAPPRKTRIAGFVQALGDLPATTGNTVTILADYDAVIDRLIADIDAATRSVHVLVYIFADDAVGVRVAASLGRAVSRGVRVRVMFDPVGSHRWRTGTMRLLRREGVSMREALPFHWLRRRTRRDMRNHRKLFVIDSDIGYAGSQNIVAKDFRPGIINRELVARVRGPVVSSMEAIILADWSMEDDRRPAPVAPPSAVIGSADAQMLPSGPDYPLEGFESLLVWQIHQAQDRVIIVTPYFIPDEDLLGAMYTAVRRGVRVELIVSLVVDQQIVNLSQCSYYDQLLTNGVQVYRFREFLLHAKHVTIDDRLAVVGSSNVDLRSFQLNEEASLLLYDPASIRQVVRIQEAYMLSSDPLDLATWQRRSPARKLAENTARLVNSLL